MYTQTLIQSLIQGLKDNRNLNFNIRPRLCHCSMNTKKKTATTSNGFSAFGSKVIFKKYHEKKQTQDYVIDLDYLARYKKANILSGIKFVDTISMFSFENNKTILRIDLECIRGLNKQKIGNTVPISFTETSINLGASPNALTIIDLTYLLTIKNMPYPCYAYINNKASPVIFGDKLTKDFNELEWWLVIMPIATSQPSIEKVEHSTV